MDAQSAPHNRPGHRFGLVVLFLGLFSSSGCLDFERQTALFVFVPEKDEVHALFVYEGLRVGDVKSAKAAWLKLEPGRLSYTMPATPGFVTRIKREMVNLDQLRRCANRSTACWNAAQPSRDLAVWMPRSVTASIDLAIAGLRS
jgi:hypothetical protein